MIGYQYGVPRHSPVNKQKIIQCRKATMPSIALAEMEVRQMNGAHFGDNCQRLAIGVIFGNGGLSPKAGVAKTLSESYLPSSLPTMIVAKAQQPGAAD